MGKIFVIIMSLFLSQIFAQLNPEGQIPLRRSLLIKGLVFDKETDSSLEYASISLYRINLRTKDTSFVTGILTDKKGEFVLKNLRPGVYILKVDFIGYRMKEIFPVVLKPSDNILDMGKIYLEPVSFILETQKVKAEPVPITYKVDKKVIEVSKQATSLSGTAVDVLKNVPSVSVDIEENVKLRGSENFSVYIDGRPTVLEPNDALKQIPASAIDKIEIITNPSAKYDPEGVVGIVNIILKKSRLQGISGVINLNAGLDEKYGGNILLTWKREIISTFLGLNYDKRTFPGNMNSERMLSDTKIESDGTFKRAFNPAGIRAGIDFKINEKNTFGISGSYGFWKMEGKGNLNYIEFSDSIGEINYKTYESFKRSGPYYDVVLNDLQNFKKDGHKLYTEFMYAYRKGDEETSTYKEDEIGSILNGQKATEKGPSRRIIAKVDYSLPLNKNLKFETGYQGSWRRNRDITDLYEYNNENGNYELKPEFHHDVEYMKNIQSIYAIFSREKNNLGYQLGLRAEYTDRKIEYADTNLKFLLERWDYFPTVHFSYRFKNATQLMASYTRRISRPRGWMFEPFITWMDTYNARKGNPDLKPEYIDNYEAGFQTSLFKGFLSFDVYYRITHNEIERVNTLYQDSVFLHTFENVGKSSALGTEISYNKNIFTFWNINPMIDFYDYKLKGELFDEKFSKESFDWNLRFNTYFILSRTMRIQLIARYHSPSVSAQGDEKEFYTLDLALQKTFFERKLTLNLQIRDIFQTSKREFRTEGDGYTYNQIFKRKSPVLILTLTYNFNNYKPEKKIRREDTETEGEFEF